MSTRRQFLKLGAAGGASLYFTSRLGWAGRVFAQVPGGTLPPDTIPKFATPLAIPPAMPRMSVLTTPAGVVDYYEIAVRQFAQQILPPGLPVTTVWGYGSPAHPGTFNYPAFTLEATCDRPVRVKWINGLVNGRGRYLPHILPVDQTLHWANPPGGTAGRDMRGYDQAPYQGPVPIVTHVHGGHTGDESDGFPEAWFLPSATNLPRDYATEGSWYNVFKGKFNTKFGVAWEPGSATFQYPNQQRATTLWYHDHTLGMTRVNVYAGPAGFYLVRGGADDLAGGLPGPAPAVGDPAGMSYYEIPIVIQDRSFNADGSLFYPDNRAFFEGLEPSKLRIPFIPDLACDGLPSDVSPIWNPEFFGNVTVVNGVSWPYLTVEQRRYRLRFLNGCDSRFLILKFDRPGLHFWQIGADGGFLPSPVRLEQLLIAPAERADVVVDFTDVPAGTEILLLNVGPDEPFGGGVPDVDFAAADPASTGQVMQLRVVPSKTVDVSLPPEQLVLPARARLAPESLTRQVSLNEEESQSVRAATRGNDMVMLACQSKKAEPFGPTAAKLGTLDADGNGVPRTWMEPVTENPQSGDTEVWEIHNFTEDAHPIHVHMVMFEVVNRENVETGEVRPPEVWETGSKDTVVAYPGEITRVKATFDLEGRYVWHCHILEHEDNEMMRPYVVGPIQNPMT